jgi:hypothetical protein
MGDVRRNERGEGVLTQPIKQRGAGRPPLYRWEQWFRAEKFILRRGVDYTCPTSSMIQQLRNAASRHRVSVRILDLGDSLTVFVV